MNIKKSFNFFCYYVFVILLFSNFSVFRISAREMVSVIIPANHAERSILANTIHLDKISENEVRSIITKEEYNELLATYIHPIQVVAIFNTDDNNFENPAAMKVFSLGGDKSISRRNSMLISHRTPLSIDLNKFFNDIPEIKLGDWKIEFPPQFVKNWSFSSDSGTFYLTPAINSKGHEEVIQFFNQDKDRSISLKIKISYL